MNPVVVVLFALLVICLAGLGVAMLVEYSRALGIERAEATELRRRLQVARLVIDDLVDHPSDAALKLGRAWLADEDNRALPSRIRRMQ